MNAEITPTEMNPFTAKYPPKAAMMTKPMLLMQFITGPMTPLKISVRMPARVSSSEVSQNSRVMMS